MIMIMIIMIIVMTIIIMMIIMIIMIVVVVVMAVAEDVSWPRAQWGQRRRRGASKWALQVKCPGRRAAHLSALAVSLPEG